jgi:hypothetical protein
MYAVKEGCFGPKAISINGAPVIFTRAENNYRQGGAIIPADQFSGLLNQQDNQIEISL